MVNGLDHVAARAITPDQLAGYVAAVSGLSSVPCGNFVLHHGYGSAVLVAFGSASDNAAIDAAVEIALGRKGINRLTVLAAVRPAAAPPEASVDTDSYWFMPLPAKLENAKLRNMLKRAAKDVSISTATGANAWTTQHEELADNFCKRKNGALSDGSVHIFHNLASYITKCPDAVVFSATKADGTLAACAIGDFTSFSTAFYMFAFRHPAAPPGTSDLLLSSICEEGTKRGHESLNLGLGMNPGVEFFKKKWGAISRLPYVETTWDVPKSWSSWLKRLFSR